MDAPCENPRLPHRIKRLYQLQAQAIGDVLKPYGLARTQWQVLSYVSRRGPLTQRELQTLLMVEPATLTGIVDGLAAKGLVERCELDTDRRVKVVSLTEAGRERFADIPDVVEVVEATMLEGVGERDLRVMERVMERMTDNLGRRER